MHKSLAQATRTILEQKPYMCYALESGVANYFALAKKIQPEVEGILNRRRQY